MTLIFFGSSDFSIPALKACLDSGHNVLLVVTTPHKKRGRGLKESPTPVWTLAAEKNLEVENPKNLKSPECLKRIQSLKPDLFVVSSYGKWIPSAWLKVPSKFALNVHPSLLPKYRGAAPINWTILNGDAQTGVTIMEVIDELDAGDIFYQTRVPLKDEEDAEMLSNRLADISYDAILKVLRQIESGKTQKVPQEASKSTYARKLEKADGRIDWNASAAQIVNKVRGLKPWPIAFTEIDQQPVQILRSRRAKHAKVGCAEGRPGQLLEINHKEGTLRVQTGKGGVFIDSVRPAGKKEMTGAAFAHGRHLEEGSYLSPS